MARIIFALDHAMARSAPALAAVTAHAGHAALPRLIDEAFAAEPVA